MGAMSTAVVFEQPGKMALRSVRLPEPHSTDCVIEVRWTGISTGTERVRRRAQLLRRRPQLRRKSSVKCLVLGGFLRGRRPPLRGRRALRAV